MKKIVLIFLNFVNLSVFLVGRRFQAEINRYRYGKLNCLVRMQKIKLGSDYWFKKPNGDLACSHCGSMHPDAVLDIANSIVDGTSYPRFVIQRQNNPHEFHVWQPDPDSKDSWDEGSRFYMGHAPRNYSDASLYERTFFDALFYADRVCTRVRRRKSRKIGMNHKKGGVKV